MDNQQSKRPSRESYFDELDEWTEQNVIKRLFDPERPIREDPIIEVKKAIREKVLASE